MKRRVIQRRVVVWLLLLLVGGAIANVTVAWGCAFLIVDGSTSVGQNGPSIHSAHWNVTSFTRLGAIRIYGRYSRMAWMPGDKNLWVEVPNWSRFIASPTSSLDGWVDDARGWPLVSLRVSFKIWDSPNSASGIVIERIGGIALPSGENAGSTGLWDLRALPLLPIWPGFAINMIFYAAMLWVVFFVPGQLKRTLRRRRGLCPACAYPIATSEVCTECGGPTANVKTSTRQNVKRVESSESA